MVQPFLYIKDASRYWSGALGFHMSGHMGSGLEFRVSFQEVGAPICSPYSMDFGILGVPCAFDSGRLLAAGCQESERNTAAKFDPGYVIYERRPRVPSTETRLRTSVLGAAVLREARRGRR